ncbi:AAA family ATPase [Tenggerimyces flavus]|uniref:AAA family ATPase n=1 Tax=Tenggerimyces flavus TaxID=1708749 RepID=A0ABV7YKZ8_9ACTN|nr:AAA family ATPase [Tenggerimyces flavus]MBM7789461.1 glucokinase [Tenggerimyces flavus]
MILVNGVPGSGKSTLARPLARALGLPLFAKDVIKETWADFLAPDGRSPREWSMLLGAAASETMWRLLAESPIGGIVDSPHTEAMRPHVEAGLARSGIGHPLELWCDVPLELAAQRCDERQPTRHAIHASSAGTIPTTDSPGPLAIGPVLRVDTSTTVDIERVAAWCREQPVGQRPLSAAVAARPDSDSRH